MVKLTLKNLKPYINIKAMIAQNIFIACSIVGSIGFLFIGFIFGRYCKRKEDRFFDEIYEDYKNQQNNE